MTRATPTRTSPRVRCSWATNALLIQYHDREWGVPVHADRRLFEFLILEGAQAGLSWHTILQKRAAFREAFDRFDATSIARYNARHVRQLLNNPGIIRNRLKIQAAIANAQAFLAVQKTFGSFDAYLWPMVKGRTIHNRWNTPQDVPCFTPVAVAMSRDLKRRGFAFVGPTICYAFMQAIGMVNDHTTNCFRYRMLRQHDRPGLPSASPPRSSPGRSRTG